MKKFLMPTMIILVLGLPTLGGWWLYRFNVAEGAGYAEEKCGGCHDLTNQKKNDRGPYLWGIVNRRAAVVPGFEYSDAFLQFAGARKFSWSEANLDLFITDPGRLIPGTKMADDQGDQTHRKAFEGIKELENRQKLITFLRTLK